MKITKICLLYALFLAGCIALPLSAAELVSIENVALVEADLVPMGGRISLWMTC